MRHLLILYFSLGLLIPLTSLGQLNISNTVDLIKKNKVKEVRLFQTKLSDTSNNQMENLRLTFSYDTLGRRIALEDYFRGKLMGTRHFYYDNNSFDCLKSEYISNLTGQANSNTATGGDIFDCQQEIYSSSSKFIISYTSAGLISVIVGYSKILTEKRAKGNINDKNGNPTNDCMQTVDTNDPQFILRFEYTFY